MGSSGQPNTQVDSRELPAPPACRAFMRRIAVSVRLTATKAEPSGDSSARQRHERAGAAAFASMVAPKSMPACERCIHQATDATAQAAPAGVTTSTAPWCFAPICCRRFASAHASVPRACTPCLPRHLWPLTSNLLQQCFHLPLLQVHEKTCSPSAGAPAPSWQQPHGLASRAGRGQGARARSTGEQGTNRCWPAGAAGEPLTKAHARQACHVPPTVSRCPALCSAPLATALRPQPPTPNPSHRPAMRARTFCHPDGWPVWVEAGSKQGIHPRRVAQVGRHGCPRAAAQREPRLVDAASGRGGQAEGARRRGWVAPTARARGRAYWK